MAVNKLNLPTLAKQVDAVSSAFTEAELDQLAQRGITAELQPDGSTKWFAIHPKTEQKVEIDPEQIWFWSAEWQEREVQADDDLQSGRYETFDNFDDFLIAL
jgi:hypothetical protein